MRQVIVEHYDLYTNADTGEIRFLLNFEYLIALENHEIPAFQNAAVISDETLTMPAQRMEIQRIIPSALSDDETLWDLNYYTGDSDLSDYHRGDVELVEFIFPRHEDAVEFLAEIEFLAELELARPH